MSTRALATTETVERRRAGGAVAGRTAAGTAPAKKTRVCRAAGVLIGLAGVRFPTETVASSGVLSSFSSRVGARLAAAKDEDFRSTRARISIDPRFRASDPASLDDGVAYGVAGSYA